MRKVLGVLILACAGAALSHAAALPAIEAARVSLERSNLDESQRSAALNALDEALTFEREADALETRLDELSAEVADVPERVRQLSSALAIDREQSLQEWARRLPTDADRETLERLLERERALVRDLQAQIDEVGAQLAATVSRPAQSASETAALRRRIEPLTTPMLVPEGEPASVTEARRLRRASELRRLQTELDLRLAEQDTATERERLHVLTIRELRFRLGLHDRRVELLQRRIADLAREELNSLLQGLRNREAELASAPAPVAAAASENRRFGDELEYHDGRLVLERAAVAGVESARDHVTVTLRDSRTRLELGVASERVGEWLWSEWRRLEAPARLRQRLEQARVALADLRLRLVALSEQQRQLIDIDRAANAHVDANRASDEDAEVDAGVMEQLESELQRRVELLSQLESLVQRRIRALEQGERALTGQLDTTIELQTLFERRLLWIPSHPSVDRDWLSRVPDGLRDLVKRSRFLTTTERIVRDVQARPWTWLGSLALLLAAIAARVRARPWIEAQAQWTRKIRQDSFFHTLRALAGTLICAAPLPLAIGLLAQLLQDVGDPGRFTHSLGRALMALVLPLCAVQLLRFMTIERGLGHAHFRWSRPRREAIQRSLPIAAAIVFPLAFIAYVAMMRQVDVAIDVNARIAIVVVSLTLGWHFWHRLDAGQIWVVRGVADEPSTIHRLLRIAVPGGLVTVAALSLLGYVYAAGIILRAGLTTFALIVLIALGSGLLARWFLLGERRLMVRRLEERRAAAVELDAEAGEVAQEPEEDLTLEQVNAQTGRLLRAVRLTLLGLGLVWVWADVLPAIARFDEIALWHFTETATDGSTIQIPVTLAGVLLGGFALALTVIGARNLPGLVEISLLSRTHIDAASRYAITSMLRYAIAIGGTVIGLGFLGMRWSQLQWLAAALTVGLGFGLQEIFANFVSGLILLFERPFRVGDTITVDNLSGRVTRIRTRATTILDWDNKEIVVPNKTFITGQLVNWTLTDTTTRVTIQVGVAYGSPVDTVHALLLQAAREEPRVLRDPEPLTWFLAFGASSLDFELRVFVGTLGDRLIVQNSLNTRIAQLFAEHGIEIAFPQLDLHVRDLPQDLRGAAPA